MKRLRHPIRAIREPFGTAGLIVAMVALVAALGGTALAAAKLNSTQKKEVEKIAKKYAGKPGAPGATGPAGPAGANGKDGTNGTNGTAGTNGTNGKSVTIGSTAPGCGARGGHTIEVAGESTTKQNVCNGEEGSPWTELGVLPPEQAEEGTWAMSEVTGPTTAGGARSAISFTVPLAGSIDASHVQIVDEEKVGTGGCEGGTTEEPVAEPGYLCIYVTLGNRLFEENLEMVALSPEVLGEEGAGRAGTILTVPDAPVHTYGFGEWMVRAPTGS